MPELDLTKYVNKVYKDTKTYAIKDARIPDTDSEDAGKTLVLKSDGTFELGNGAEGLDAVEKVVLNKGEHTADLMISYSVNFTAGVDDDPCAFNFNNLLANEEEFVGTINQTFSTSYTSIDDVRDAWPTLAAALVSQTSLKYLVNYLATAWIISPKASNATVSLGSSNLTETDFSNSCTIAESGGGALYIGGSLVNTYVGGTFTASALTFVRL